MYILFYLHDPQTYGRCNRSPLCAAEIFIYLFFSSSQTPKRYTTALHTTSTLSATSPTLQSRMASGSPAQSPAGKPSQAYACKCLNVQITSSAQAPASSPEGTCDPPYEPIFVSDEGIVIVGFFFDLLVSNSSIISLRHIPK